MSNEISESLAKELKLLWEDQAVQTTVQRANEFQLYDSTE